MDLSRFKPLQEVVRRVGEAAARWNHLQPENADEPVLWPGQPELLTRRQRLTDGIPVGIETLAQLNKLSSGVQNK